MKLIQPGRGPGTELSGPVRWPVDPGKINPPTRPRLRRLCANTFKGYRKLTGPAAFDHSNRRPEPLAPPAKILSKPVPDPPHKNIQHRVVGIQFQLVVSKALSINVQKHLHNLLRVQRCAPLSEGRPRREVLAYKKHSETVTIMPDPNLRALLGRP